MRRLNTGGLPCKTAARCGGARVYSPGGCGCALLMFPVVAAGAGIALALSGVALMAAVCLIIAVGITVFSQRQRIGVANRARRWADGSSSPWRYMRSQSPIFSSFGGS